MPPVFAEFQTFHISTLLFSTSPPFDTWKKILSFHVKHLMKEEDSFYFLFIWNFRFHKFSQLLIHESRPVVTTIFTCCVCTSFPTFQISSEHSDRYWRNCESGRVDHWWHICLVLTYVFVFVLFGSLTDAGGAGNRSCCWPFPVDFAGSMFFISLKGPPSPLSGSATYHL